MSKFLNGRLTGLIPYVPGEQPKGGSLIKLNTNELPYGPSPLVRKAGEGENLALYPDPTVGSLTAALASRYGVQPENVFVGNGSDEVLAFAYIAFCGPDKGVCFPETSYGFYPVYARLFGPDALALPLKADWSVDIEPYKGCGRTIFIANPNAPTGLALKSAQIEELLLANPEDVVAIDEAYVDFGGESVVPLTSRYDNLLVIQTFSKSRGLAGARIGYAVGNRELIQDLNTIKFSFNPYNINRLSMAAGLAALEDRAYYDDCCARVAASREAAQKELRTLGFQTLDSVTNFLFVRHPAMEGEHLYQALRERGILVRYFGGEKLKDWLRITVGTQSQMETLIEKIREITEELQ